MGIEVITEFPSASSVRTWAFVYKNEPSDNSLTDPTAIVNTIIDPDEDTQVDEEAMTKSTTGIYYHDYHVGVSAVALAKGMWRGKVRITDGAGATAFISVFYYSFKVK